MPTKGIKFVDTVIRNLKPEKKRVVLWCESCPGFGLRLTPTGAKTFVFKYTKNGNSKWLTIGRYPEWTIRQARTEYDKQYDAVYLYGKDPIAQREEKRINIDNQKTVEQYFREKYVPHLQHKQLASTKEIIRGFEKDILPIIGKDYLQDVTSEQIDTIQKNIIARSATKPNRESGKRGRKRDGRVGVSRTLSYLSTFFNHAINKDANGMTKNPVKGVDSLGEIRVRSEILSFEEIWSFWHGIDQLAVPAVSKFALKFCLATMQRIGEVGSMQYSGVNTSEKIWQLEANETKNKTVHRVPLNKYAIQVLIEVRKYTGKSDYVFGSTRRIQPPKEPLRDLVPYTRSALSKLLRVKRELLSLGEVSPHDFRRTGATWITAVGVPELSSALLLNHKENKKNVTGINYIHYSYDHEKQLAMNVWEFILDRILEAPEREAVPNLEQLRQMVIDSELLRR
jgi:integrase